MKNLLFTSTLFLIVNFSFAQTKIENDLTRDGLKGKVSLYSKQTYKYDVKGNMIEENSCNADGSLSDKYTYKCEFDAMGNWIKQTLITDGKPKQLTERVIEYY